MTKKHFKELARMLKGRRSAIGNPKTHRLLCVDIASFCAEQNPRFDRTRFLDACGCNDEIEADILRQEHEFETRGIEQECNSNLKGQHNGTITM